MFTVFCLELSNDLESVQTKIEGIGSSVIIRFKLRVKVFNHSAPKEVVSKAISRSFSGSPRYNSTTKQKNKSYTGLMSIQPRSNYRPYFLSDV